MERRGEARNEPDAQWWAAGGTCDSRPPSTPARTRATAAERRAARCCCCRRRRDVREAAKCRESRQPSCPPASRPASPSPSPSARRAARGRRRLRREDARIGHYYYILLCTVAAAARVNIRIRIYAAVGRSSADKSITVHVTQWEETNVYQKIESIAVDKSISTTRYVCECDVGTTQIVILL